jgi:transcriptional regulator with XRE-family HTH domain
MTDTIAPIELRSRRLALGLAQGELSEVLGNAQVTVSRWECGTRPIPERLDAELRTLERLRDDLEEEIVEQVEHKPAMLDTPEVALPTPANDAEAKALGFDAPAGIVRVAIARAANALRDELGIVARLIPVENSSKGFEQ